MTEATTAAVGPKRTFRVPPEAGIAAVLVLLLFLGSLVNPNFLTVSNMKILLLNGSVIAFLTLGQSFVLLTGGIDLSSGSVVAMTCVLSAVLMEYLGIPWPIASLMILGIGASVGMISGMIINFTGVPPFIVTFAMMGVAASIPQIITGAESIRISQLGFKFVGQARVMGIPVPVIALAVAVVMAIVFLRRTVTGTHIMAAGGNADAARLSGISIPKIKVLVYGLSGLCAGAGGLIYASRLMTGYPTAGRGDELFFSIAGAVVGGVSLFGGIGTIPGAMIGAMLIASISNFMNVMNVSAFWQPLVIGVIILLGVAFDTMRTAGKLSFRRK
ncbi:MAG: ABC transporter permease [Paracoccaceae bacterium]